MVKRKIKNTRGTQEKSLLFFVVKLAFLFWGLILAKYFYFEAILRNFESDVRAVILRGGLTQESLSILFKQTSLILHPAL